MRRACYMLKEMFPKTGNDKLLPSVPRGRSLPGTRAARVAACGSVVSPRPVQPPRWVQQLQLPKLGPVSRATLLMVLRRLNSGARIFVVAFFLNRVNCFHMKELLISTNKTQILARSVVKV